MPSYEALRLFLLPAFYPWQYMSDVADPVKEAWLAARPTLHVDIKQRKAYIWGMEVQFTPDKLDRLAAETGCPKEEVVQDAMAGYFDELQEVRGTLDSRYDDIKSGEVKLIPGEEAIARLRAKSAARDS